MTCSPLHSPRQNRWLRSRVHVEDGGGCVHGNASDCENLLGLYVMQVSRWVLPMIQSWRCGHHLVPVGWMNHPCWVFLVIVLVAALGISHFQKECAFLMNSSALQLEIPSVSAIFRSRRNFF